MTHTCKILTLIMTHRIYYYCECMNLFVESQYFRADRSTIDMIFIAKALQQTCREKQIALYLAFLDIAKAYDSVHRQTLWKILQAIGIPPKMMALCKALYGKTSCRVRLNGKFSKGFLIEEGLKQGCPAACIFFNIFFAVILLLFTKNLETEELNCGLDWMEMFLI